MINDVSWFAETYLYVWIELAALTQCRGVGVLNLSGQYLVSNDESSSVRYLFRLS